MQNLTGVHAADIRDRDRLVLPAGDAALSYVDTRDVAGRGRFRCLLDEVPIRGAWDLTGPEAITHTQIAAALSEALGRPVRYTPASLPRYWAACRTGMPVGVTAATSVLYTLARVGVGSRVSGDLAPLLGRQPHNIRRFAHDHRATWTR